MVWSINNLDSYLDQEVWRSFVDYRVAASALLGSFVLSLGYPLVHRFYMSRSEKYANVLSTEQRVVVVQHTMEAAVLTLLWGPLTYLVLSMFFEEEEDIDVFSRKFATTASMEFLIIIMYTMEIAARQEMRALLIVHHGCTCFNGIYAAYFLTTANVKSAVLLTYFVTFEAMTFVGLVLYRLAPGHRLTRPVILLGIIVFTLSRPVQYVWIVASLITSWEKLNIIHAVLQMTMATLFTALQFYSVVIHCALYRKCSPKLLGKSGVERTEETTVIEEASRFYIGSHQPHQKKPGNDIEAGGSTV